MCCLSIYKTKDHKVVITHNRDEQKSRQLAANQLIPEIINGRKVWMPKDAQSNGTWIATDGQVAGALLNGFKENHVKKDAYRASRGNIIPSLFQMQSIEKFVSDFDPDGYEPFTLVMFGGDDRLLEYGWDEQKIYITNLDSNLPHIYSSPTLYNNEVKINRAQQFFKWLKNDCSENDIWHLHATKGKDHNKFLNVDYNQIIRTVALSQIVLCEHPIFHYQSLLSDCVPQTVLL